MRNLVLLATCLLLTVVALARTITVDNDAPSDFNNIRAAIDHSSDGDVIDIWAGTYQENISFGGKVVKVTSTDPNGLGVVTSTIIDANSQSSCVVFNHGEDGNSGLEGFTLTNGIYAQICRSSCVYCDIGS